MTIFCGDQIIVSQTYTVIKGAFVTIITETNDRLQE
jgi:hypothetical protein